MTPSRNVLALTYTQAVSVRLGLATRIGVPFDPPPCSFPSPDHYEVVPDMFHTAVFEGTPAEGAGRQGSDRMRYLGNSSAEGASKHVSDLRVWGEPDAWLLIAKASSQAEGWMKSTKAFLVPGAGVLVQVTTEVHGEDGRAAVAEALTFVPGACVVAYHSDPDASDDPPAVTRREIKVLPHGPAAPSSNYGVLIVAVEKS